MRSAVTVAVVAGLALLGCEQRPDVVAYSVPLDTGGVGGGSDAQQPGASGAGVASGGVGAMPAGGSGGMMLSGGTGATVSGGTSGEPQAPSCDTMTLVTLALFTQVAREDCTFHISEGQLIWLLTQHIFQHDPVPIDPEAAPPDVVCNMWSNPPNEIARVRPAGDGNWVICPAYCASLNQWIDRQQSMLDGCLPDAGMISP